MQAQYNVCYSPHSSSLDYCHAPVPNTYSTVPDPHCAAGGANGGFSGNFSRGSSSLAYLHEDYQYMTTPREPPCFDAGGVGNPFSSTAYTHAPPTQTMSTAIGGGAGVGYTEDGNIAVGDRGLIASFDRTQYGHPEEVPAFYHDQRWEWDYHLLGEVTVAPPRPPPHALACPYPYQPALLQLPSNTRTSGVLPPDPVSVDLASAIKSAATVEQPHAYPVRSSTAQLSTSATMAVSSSSNRRRKERMLQIAVDTAHLPVPMLQPSSSAQMRPGVASATALISNPDVLSREKKHACTMCHKRFDRPSTLRKHLLVHTGEKAFVCETCGRRFGVASNLNRHARRCILKPVNAAVSSASATSVSPSTSHNTASEMSADHSISSGEVGALKRGRTPSSTGSESAPSPSSSSSSDQPSAQKTGADGTRQKAPGQKRRRRAPSPSLWVPWSLRAFNLACEELHLSTPVPLPPVRRNLPTEERDSWDENVSSRPYHPQEWKGVLPGPGFGNAFGLGGKDIRNIDLGGSGGIMLGRVLVC